MQLVCVADKTVIVKQSSGTSPRAQVPKRTTTCFDKKRNTL